MDIIIMLDIIKTPYTTVQSQDRGIHVLDSAFKIYLQRTQKRHSISLQDQGQITYIILDSIFRKGFEDPVLERMYQELDLKLYEVATLMRNT